MFLVGLLIQPPPSNQRWLVVYDGRDPTRSRDASRYAYVPLSPIAAASWIRPVPGVPWKSFEALRAGFSPTQVPVITTGPVIEELAPLVSTAPSGPWLTPNQPTILRFPVKDVATGVSTLLSVTFDSQRYLVGVSRADLSPSTAKTFDMSVLF